MRKPRATTGSAVWDGLVPEWVSDWLGQGVLVPDSWCVVSPELVGVERAVLVDSWAAGSSGVADERFRGLLRVHRDLGDPDAVMVVVALLVRPMVRICGWLSSDPPELMNVADVDELVLSTLYEVVCGFELRESSSRIAANVVLNTRSRCLWDFKRGTRRMVDRMGTFDPLGPAGWAEGRSSVWGSDSWGEFAEREELLWLRQEVEAALLDGAYSRAGSRFSIDADTAFFLAAGRWVYGVSTSELAVQTGLGSSQVVRDRLVALRRIIRRRSTDEGALIAG